MSDALAWLEEERAGRALGHRAHHLASAPSTQQEAHKLAREGAPHGTLVVADRQTAGKGRAGRTWLSSEGGLYLSLVLRPRLAPERMPRLTLLAGAGLLDALLEAGLDAYAKWPNDLLVKQEPAGPLGRYRKVCGVLVEGILGSAGLEGAILGVGLNLRAPEGGFPPPLTDLAAALAEHGLAWSREEALRRVLEHLEARLQRPDDDELFRGALARLKERSCTLSREVVVAPEGTRGVAEAFDEDGALLIRTASGTLVRVVAGDVWPRA